jgi:hypothetical protein
MRLIAKLILIVASSAADAAIIESEWASPIPQNNDAELVVVGGKMQAIAPTVTSFGRERRGWNRMHPTLATDWAAEAHVHADALELPVSEFQFLNIGIELGRLGTPNGLAILSVRLNPNAPIPQNRVVQAGYTMGPGGRSDETSLSATDVVLRLSYSASDRSMRTYFKPVGGAFSQINAYSVHGWNVPPEEPLELSMFVEPWFVHLMLGQAYIQDFTFLPEPSLTMWLAMIPLLYLRNAYSWLGSV